MIQDSPLHSIDLRQNKSANFPALIFLPRIKGFSSLISKTEIEHSQHIISELLELIIHHNRLDLSLSEIEDNALLFYRKGGAPRFKSVMNQVKSMYLAFHRHLLVIQRDSVCRCGACQTADRLELCFIVHYGTISLSRIADMEKLIGEDVILVHRLLKNGISEPEYLLATKSYLKQLNAEQPPISMKLNRGCDHYEHIGDVPYNYFVLHPWHNNLKTELRKRTEKEMPEKAFCIEWEIYAPMQKVYEMITDLSQRKKWMAGLLAIKYDEQEIMRLGTAHECRLPIGKMELQSEHRHVDSESMSYAEKIAESRWFAGAIIYYRLRNSNGNCRINLDFHFENPRKSKKIIYKPMLEIMKIMMRVSLKNLKHYCESVEPSV